MPAPDDAGNGAESDRTTDKDQSSAREWPLRRLVSDVVGSGPKSTEDLTPTQARAALEQILADEPDPTTLGAFFLANRWKGNTPTELGAYVDAMRERSVETAAPSADPVDCGANYDGKSETALLGVAAGVVAAAAGTPVVVHSGDRVPVNEGVAYAHVLAELGVLTDLAPAESADMVDATGFGFYYQPRCNPLVAALTDRRRATGVRTFLNTIETLADPADASVHLGSFYHLAFARKLAGTIDASERLPFERAVFFQGLEGYDDVRPGQTTVAEWRGDGDDVEASEVRTADLGLDVTEDDLRVEDVAAESAAITDAVLRGERDGPLADAVALNAALRVYAADDAASVADGLDAARDVIADGSAAAVLDDVRAYAP